MILAVIGIGLLIALFGGAFCGWLAMREIGKLRVIVKTLERRVGHLLGVDRDAVDPAKNPVSKPEPTLKTVVVPKPIPLAAKTTQPVRVPKPKPAPKPTLDLETLLGAKGSVWIGGLALLLGAVFLLRYTIEAGMLTPVMRISVAILMGVIALGLSEWMARRDLKTPVGKAFAAKADIPAILAAVGVFSLFGAVYTAHALYGLLSTLPTFIALAAIALGTMALSLRRGPWLAAIGLIGALAVPLLVASVTPSYLGVLAYVAIITGAALWVAQRQTWPWLRAAALVGATVWLTILLGKSVGGLQFGFWTLGVIAVTALTLRDIMTAKDGTLSREWAIAGWAGVAILTALAMLAGDDWSPMSYVLPFIFLLGLMIAAWRADADLLWPLLPIGGGLFALIACLAVLPSNAEPAWPFLAALTGAALVFVLTILSVSNPLKSGKGATALIAVGGVILWIIFVGGFDRVTPYNSALYLWPGFILSGVFGVATLLQSRLAVVQGAIWVAALAWLSGVSLLTGLQIQSITLCAGLAALIGLAVMGRAGRDDVWVRLAPLALAGGAGLTALAVLRDPSAHIAATPVLNSLWLHFGLPGALAAVGAILLRRRREDLASQALLGGAIVFALLLIVLLIHHAMNAGDLTVTPGFEDYAVQLLVAFAALFGASWLRGGLTDWPKIGSDPWRFIVPTLALLASGLSLFVFVTAQLLGFNPLITAQTVIEGHSVFNSLMLGYLAPAVLLGGAALRSSGRRPVWFVRVLGALAGGSWLVWTTAQIRRFAQGETIAMDTVPWGNGELYAVSAVWLLTGIAVLLAGMKTGRRDLRLASAGLITLTTLKVFLIDMSALDGAFRAISFIGLGVVLIGIGRLYQTVLAGPEGGTGPESSEAERV